MSASTVRPRRLLAAVLVACFLAALAAAAAPPPAAAGAAESVLVVRGAGDHDALWLLDPSTGAPVAAGELPGRAGSAAVSPDGHSVAYLTKGAAPRVWIGYGPLAPRTISLAGAGVRRADTFCWIDGNRLLVSAARSRNASFRNDRLYIVNAATGAVRWFRRLYGVEPSYAATVRKVAYIKFTVVSPGTSGSAATVRESLKLLSLSGTGGGRTIWSEENRSFAEYRAVAQPQVSGDGRWYLTRQTGSDVRVTYDIRDRWGYPELSLFTPALPAGGGWDASARRVAFAGVADPFVEAQGCVWVYDSAAGSLTRSAVGLIPSGMIDALAWSPSGRLVAGAYMGGAENLTLHALVLPGDLSVCTDLGTGRLPVWVTP